MNSLDNIIHQARSEIRLKKNKTESFRWQTYERYKQQIYRVMDQSLSDQQEINSAIFKLAKVIGI